MLTDDQLKTIEAALFSAYAEFKEEYHKSFYFAWKYEETDAWCYTVLEDCQQYGNDAIRYLSVNKSEEAKTALKAAIALEGDFNGWMDFRVYNTPLLLLKSFLEQL
jgi:hypothetical protein